MPWDPLGAWPKGRRWLWAGLAGLVGCLQGPAFIRSLRPPPDQGVDYFQLWASARNLLHGLPVSESFATTTRRYLGHRPGEIRLTFEKSSQTPTAVLLALPFAGLSY